MNPNIGCNLPTDCTYPSSRISNKVESLRTIIKINYIPYLKSHRVTGWPGKEMPSWKGGESLKTNKNKVVNVSNI